MTTPSLASPAIVLVTGASTGIGRAIATLLAGAGHRVFGTSRDPARAAPAAFPMLALDVRSDASVARCVAEVITAAGRIDALVNNAGHALVAAVEETSLAQARDQMETNCFGALRMIHAVVPAMRRRRSGRIVNISSVSGVLAPPFLGAYAASKHALEALSESLAFEVRPHGVAVSLVELDAMRTGIAFAGPERPEAAYDAPRGRMLDRLVRGSQETGEDPQVVARCVVEILTATAPRLRYELGAETVRLLEARRRLSEAEFMALATAQLGLWDRPEPQNTTGSDVPIRIPAGRR